MHQPRENNTYKFKEETKTQQKEIRPKEFTRDKPFKYETNSDHDDYDSEQDVQENNKKLHQANVDKDKTYKTLQSAQDNKPSKRKPDASPNFSLRNKAKLISEDEESDGNNWIGGDKNFKSARGDKHFKFDSPSSSLQIGSASTHTSQKFQYNLSKKKTTGEKYLDKNEFKSFLQNEKRQVLSERNETLETTRKSKSPFRIVDKLLDDAQRRLLIKQENEQKGNDTALALAYSSWNRTLRNNKKNKHPRSLHSQSVSRNQRDSQVLLTFNFLHRTEGATTLKTQAFKGVFRLKESSKCSIDLILKKSLNGRFLNENDSLKS